MVSCMSRSSLGFITKFAGQKASVVGIFNFQGANDEFNHLVEIANTNRLEFYKRIRETIRDPQELQLLIKENKFLIPSMLLSQNDKVDHIMKMASYGAPKEDIGKAGDDDGVELD